MWPAESQTCRREPGLGRGEDDEGMIWADLLVGEPQVFSGIKASDALHPALSPDLPNLVLYFQNLDAASEKEETRNQLGNYPELTEI